MSDVTLSGVGDSVTVHSGTGPNPAVLTPISRNSGVFRPGLIYQVDNDAQLTSLLGGNSVRCCQYFNGFFTSNHTKWPSNEEDQAVIRALDNSIALGIRPTLLITMHSNSPTQDSDGYAALDAYFPLVLAKYKGRIDMELTNEPDVGAGPHFAAPQLAAMYNHCYPRIKALDPACQVLGAAFDSCSGIGQGTPSAPVFGSPGYSYVDQFMSSASNSIDQLAVHMYYQMAPEHRYLSQAALSRRYPNKDIALTETGWFLNRTQAQSPNEAQWGCNNNSTLHADRMTRDLLLQSCVARMRQMQFYRARDTSGFRVYDGAGNDTPTSIAMRDAFPVLRGGSERRLYQIGNSDILKAVLVVAVQSTSGIILFVWSWSGTASLVIIVSGTNSVQSKILGGTTSSYPVIAGKITVPASTRPVMLSGATFPEFA